MNDDVSWSSAGDEEGELKSNSGDKSLALVAFVDAASVDASLYTGTNTMYFFGQKNAGIPSRVTILSVHQCLFVFLFQAKTSFPRISLYVQPFFLVELGWTQLLRHLH